MKKKKNKQTKISGSHFLRLVLFRTYSLLFLPRQMSLHELPHVQHGYDGLPRPLSHGPGFHDERWLLAVSSGN